MRLAHPDFLLALPLLWLGAVWLFRSADRRRRGLREKFLGTRQAGRTQADAVPRQQLLDRWLWVLAATGLVVALARPMILRHDPRSEREGVSYIIALDASRSMLAADVKPTRYSAATNALDRYFAETTADRIGLITFSGVAYLNAPLTPDTMALRTILGYVNPNALADPGSSLASVIDRAARCFASNSAPQRILVLISDGEDLEGKGPETARRLHKDQNLTVHTIGIGTAEGARIPLMRVASTNGMGAQVTTKLDEAGLRRIANAGGGRYFRFGQSGQGLKLLRDEVLRPLAEKSLREDLANYRELYFAPLGVALAALLAKLWLGARRTHRKPAPRAVLRTDS